MFFRLALSAFFTNHRAIFVKRAREKGGRARVRVHYLYFSVLCASLNTTCSIRKRATAVARLRFVWARIFIFHFNLHFSRSTHVHEKGRTLTRNSYSTRPGRRKFTSASRPPDSSRMAKLFSSNYCLTAPKSVT